MPCARLDVHNAAGVCVRLPEHGRTIASKQLRGSLRAEQTSYQRRADAGGELRNCLGRNDVNVALQPEAYLLSATISAED